MKTLAPPSTDEARAVMLLRALADPVRFRIVQLLAARDECVVGDLVDELPVSQPTVSEHLKVLKDAGLVTDRAAGTRRIYTVDHEGLSMLRAYLDQFWTRSLAGFKAAAEQEDS